VQDSIAALREAAADAAPDTRDPDLAFETSELLSNAKI